MAFRAPEKSCLPQGVAAEVTEHDANDCTLHVAVADVSVANDASGEASMHIEKKPLRVSNAVANHVEHNVHIVDQPPHAEGERMDISSPSAYVVDRPVSPVRDACVANNQVRANRVVITDSLHRDCEEPLVSSELSVHVAHQI